MISLMSVLDDHKEFVDKRIEIDSQLSFIEEYLTKIKIGKIDFFINILLNLVSYSLVLLVAFVSIPQLNANSLYFLYLLMLSLILLLLLIIYRESEINKLSSEFLGDKIKFIRLLRESENLVQKHKTKGKVGI